MQVELSGDERQLLLDLLWADLEGYWETLKEEHATVESAMATYDVTHAVTILRKLSPELAAAHREETVADLERR